MEFLEARVMFLGGSLGAGEGAGEGGAGAEVRGSRPPAAAAPATSTINNHPVIALRYARSTLGDVLRVASRLAVCAR